MKKKKRQRHPAGSLTADLMDGFVKGAVSTALAAAGTAPPNEVLRLALRGGTALAAASLASRSLRVGTLRDATAFAATGLAALLLIQRLNAAPTGNGAPY